MFARIKPKSRPSIKVVPTGPIRCRGHLQWIRGRACAIEGLNGHRCEGKIHAHHVKTETDGCMGQKPGDCWALPLCESATGGAHREIHQIGEPAFERKYGIKLNPSASRYWAVSDHGKRYRREHELENTP